MITRACRLLGVAVLALALCACVGRRSGAEKSARKYIAALQKYDIESLKKIIAPDVIVTAGRSGTTGPDELLKAVDFQAGIRTTYVCTKMVVRGDTVDVDLLEKSDLGTVIGIPETHHYERLVFEDGMLKLREIRRPTDEYQLFGERIRKLQAWLQQSHPDVAAQIEDPRTGFKGDRATGELLVRMAKEWRETQSLE